MFCTSCGRYIEDDAEYCSHCGNKIEITEIKNDVKPEEITEIKNDVKPEEITEIKNDVKPEEITEIKNDVKPEESTHSTIDISKTSNGLCLLLLTIGIAASLSNIIKFLILEKDIFSIFGQTIFLLIFIASYVLLLKSKMIGGIILIVFSLFRMVGSAYYYMEIINNGYLTKNLIIDEIFYLTMILLLIIGWKNLK